MCKKLVDTGGGFFIEEEEETENAVSNKQKQIAEELGEATLHISRVCLLPIQVVIPGDLVFCCEQL